MKAVILYHGGCTDGFTAAWAVHLALEINGYKKADIELVPLYRTDSAAREDEVIHLCAGKHVWMVDYCWNDVDSMKDLVEFAESVQVYDHHKTTKPVLDALLAWYGDGQHDDIGVLSVVFDNNRSGAGIAWDTMHPGRPRPKIVEYAEDYDLWRKSLPRIEEIATLMNNYPKTLKDWNDLGTYIGENFEQSVLDGEAMLMMRSAQVESIIETAQMVDSLMGTPLMGTCVAANCPHFLANEVGSKLLERFPQASFAATFYFDVHLNKLRVSLRSVDDRADVSEIARAHGGGGHRNAAGFIIDLEE